MVDCFLVEWSKNLVPYLSHYENSAAIFYFNNEAKKRSDSVPWYLSQKIQKSQLALNPQKKHLPKTQLCRIFRSCG